MHLAGKRIDLILGDRRRYTFENHAAQEVASYFRSIGADYKLIYLNDGILQDYIHYIEDSPPAWTLGFANLTPHKTPLCDVLQIPHFLWLEDSPSEGLHYLSSSFGALGISDAGLCQKTGSRNVYYLPHGVHSPSGEVASKEFEVVLFANLIDLPLLDKNFRDLFLPLQRKMLYQAIQCRNPLLEPDHFLYVEQYLRAQNTWSMVSRFSDLPLDIFGEHAGNNWLTRLPNQVRLHAQLPYTEHFEVLKTSKIALMEPGSTWYYPAIAAGCLPLAADPETVSYFLLHPEDRKKRVEDLQQGLGERSWPKQINQLIEFMS